MKKQALILGLVFISLIAFPQTNWITNGNSVNSGDWLGTNNSEPLLLKANNNLGIKIKPNGELMFKSLDLNSNNGPNGIVFTDGQGKIYRLDFTGNNSDFLMGNGTWKSFPALSQFSSSGENVYLPSTVKLGLGNNNPQEALDVTGNVKISGNLNIASFANGGTKFKPLYADPSGNIYSGLEFEIGWLDPATGANGCNPYSTPWKIGGNTITGSGYTDITAGTCDNFDFILKANNFSRQWIKPDGTIGFGTNVTSNTGGPEYRFKTGVIRLQSGNTYGGPQIIFDSNDNTTPYGEWGIEYTKALTKPGLNFWKPFGSTNSDNNFLFIADDRTMGIGTANPTTKLTIDSWNIDGLRILSDNNKLAINVFNKQSGKSEFLVKSNGFVYAREINVLPANLVFPDYVFADNYKMLELEKLEDYIKNNKHLPNIPPAREVEKNGINLAEMQVKQMEKIEELFLYVIELKKENDELKAKIEILQKK